MTVRSMTRSGAPGVSAAGSFWRQFRRSRQGMIGLAILVAFGILALVAPLIVDPAQFSPVVARTLGNPQWAPPSEFPPLGTDHLRRSVWAQFVWGSRVSLTVGLAATAVTMVIGTAVGVIAGYRGGRLDSFLMRITEWFLVIPFLPLAIALASVLGRSTRNIILVIGLTSWPWMARLIRSQVLTVKQRLFVDRARSLGAKSGHIIRNHILPNVSGLILANATLWVPISILSETTLSFLGLGNPGNPSWGKTLEEAFANGAMTRNAWWYFVPAGLGILAVVLAFTMVGRTLEEIADPKLGKER